VDWQQLCCRWLRNLARSGSASSGRVRDNVSKDSFAEIESLGAGALALLDLPAAHYGGYYEGFANSALWPALHSRNDLIRFRRTTINPIAKSTRSWRVR
jgi:trehalose-6-phosphate synthase